MSEGSSRGDSVGQRIKSILCLQKNKVTWKGCKCEVREIEDVTVCICSGLHKNAYFIPLSMV